MVKVSTKIFWTLYGLNNNARRASLLSGYTLTENLTDQRDSFWTKMIYKDSWIDYQNACHMTSEMIVKF